MKDGLSKLPKLIGILILVNAIFPSTAFAYLDAGTGSILLQGLFGGIVAGTVIIKGYWAKFKSFACGIFSKKTDQNIEESKQPEDNLE